MLVDGIFGDLIGAAVVIIVVVVETQEVLVISTMHNANVANPVGIVAGLVNLNQVVENRS